MSKAQILRQEARIKKLEDQLALALWAFQAFKDFDDLPTAAKRPDVFEVKVRKPMLCTLAAFRENET